MDQAKLEQATSAFYAVLMDIVAILNQTNNATDAQRLLQYWNALSKEIYKGTAPQ